MQVLHERLRLMARESSDQLDALVRERRRADEAEARAAGAEAVNAGAAMEMQAMRGTAVWSDVRLTVRRVNE
jgi:hypothetical protein